MEKNRLEAFSDGVLAIIITIMILELNLPGGDRLKDLEVQNDAQKYCESGNIFPGNSFGRIPSDCNIYCRDGCICMVDYTFKEKRMNY